MKCVEGECDGGGSEWLAWHAMASAGVGVCIQLNPWRRLGQNKGKSGHKLKVLAGRRESVERQLCDYLTVRLEFSSLFSLHTLRASLKYCSSSTYPRCCFCFASLSPWHAYVCIYVCARHVYANWWLLFVFGEFPCSTRTVHRAKTRKSVENPF